MTEIRPTEIRVQVFLNCVLGTSLLVTLPCGQAESEGKISAPGNIDYCVAEQNYVGKNVILLGAIYVSFSLYLGQQ